jgi:hypothetical protein
MITFSCGGSEAITSSADSRWAAIFKNTLTTANLVSAGFDQTKKCHYLS